MASRTMHKDAGVVVCLGPPALTLSINDATVITHELAVVVSSLLQTWQAASDSCLRLCQKLKITLHNHEIAKLQAVNSKLMGSSPSK